MPTNEFYIVPTASLDATADAIRAKTGSQASIEYTQAGFADAIDDIPSGGYTLEQISVPNFPAMTTENVVFTGQYIRPTLFKGNTYIKSFVGNNVLSVIGDIFGTGSEPRTFAGCTNLETVSLPLITDFYHADYIFNGCTKLKTVDMNFKNFTRLGTGVFKNCPALEISAMVFPNINSNVYGEFISENPYLEAFDFEKSGNNHGTSINANAFKNDSNLSVVVIRQTGKIITLGNISAFSGTPFASDGAGGTLYIPSSLLSSYESATNWSTILGYTNNQIKTIESTHTDPNAPIDLTLYYADGTLIPT